MSMYRRTVQRCLLALSFGFAAHADASDAVPARANAKSGGFVPLVVDGEVVGAVLGRYAVTAQLLPTPHQAVSATAWYHLPGLAFPWDDGLSGFGGELGWRLYSGARGPEGLFLGSSAVLGHHVTERAGWFTSGGVAVDVGWSALYSGRSIGRVDGKVHVALSAGLQMLAADVDASRLRPLPELLVGAGLHPRLAFAIGLAP